jgi:hypothetical protein
LPWNIIFVVDGFYWTYWLACTAINAFIGLDIEHAGSVIDAIDGALLAA